jgi:uncharacterized protein (TIGR00725 family)
MMLLEEIAIRTISVVGGADSTPQTLEFAERVGESVAKHGAALICGGLGGVMEAACKGAKKYDGLTVGLLPTNSRSDANPYVDIVIPTGLGYSRNFLVAKASDAVIAIGGAAGTLSEMAIAWFSDRPIVAIAGSGGWAQKLAGTKIDDRREDQVYAAETPEEALSIIAKILDWK